MSTAQAMPWLAQYPEGTPPTIDTNEFPSVADVMKLAFDRYRHRPAFVNMDKVLSYGDLDRLSTQFGAFLRNQLGLAKGDRVAIMLPNVLQYPVALMGILRAGLTVVNTNPMYTARELKHQLNDSGAKAILVLENFATTLEEVIKETPVKHVITTAVGDMLGFPKSLIVNFVVKYRKKAVPPFNLPQAIKFNDALARGKGQQIPATQIGPEDIAFLQYTGGTTGVSKGAMLTHRNMIANMLQVKHWFGPNVKEGEEIIITALPLYHIFALTANCLTFLMIGARNLLIANPRDIPNFIKEWGKYPVTVVTGVNTLFNALLNHPDFAKLDFSTMNVTLGGGMAVQGPVAEKWLQARCLGAG